MAAINKTQASSRWANVKAIQTVSLDTDLIDSDCVTSKESKRGRVQCVILHSVSECKQAEKVQYSPAPWLNTPKQTISLKEMVCQEKTLDSEESSRLHSKPQHQKTSKQNKIDITHELIQSSVKVCNITDYSVEDLMHALKTKNKKQLKKIMRRAESYTDMFTGHWFSRYFITAFEILGDSFGMYLSCKHHTKPLDVDSIMSYSKKKDSSVFAWIYNKHRSLYSIYGKQPTTPEIQNTLNILCRLDSPEFISSVGNSVSINWNNAFDMCCKHKSIKVFESILDNLTRRQMQTFITSVKFPNAGNIVFKYRLYKTEQLETFNFIENPNKINICKVLIHNKVFTEYQICKMAMSSWFSDELVNLYFTPQFFFEFPNESVKYFDLKKLLLMLEPHFFTTDFQHDDILFDKLCKNYSYSYPYNNKLSQIEEDFLQHCVYYKDFEFNYKNCNDRFRNQYCKVIENFKLTRQIEVTKIIDTTLTECNVCDDIIFNCILPYLYDTPKKTKKSAYETFKTWKEYNDSF